MTHAPLIYRHLTYGRWTVCNAWDNASTIPEVDLSIRVQVVK